MTHIYPWTQAGWQSVALLTPAWSKTHWLFAFFDSGGSGLLFNILPSEPCRQCTVHSESPSVHLKEHRQWKNCPKILQLVFHPKVLWMTALNESKSRDRPGDSGGPYCVFLLHSGFAHRSRTRSPFALSWQWPTSNPLHCYSLLRVETIFGK